MIEQHASSDVFDAAALNGMLRGELAAVETYNLALRRVDSEPLRVGLEHVRDDHQSAVCALRHWVRDLEETPAASAGAWGLFATAVTGAASVAGEAALIAALKRGERFGANMYRQGLGNPDLPDGIRHLIGSKLLPRCQEHLMNLDHLTDS